MSCGVEELRRSGYWQELVDEGRQMMGNGLRGDGPQMYRSKDVDVDVVNMRQAMIAASPNKVSLQEDVVSVECPPDRKLNGGI